jgi:hypothetical protein
MSEFIRKSFGRIYTAPDGNPGDVEEIIRQLDEFEHSYLPDKFITKWSGKIEPIYGHKFEMDIDKLTAECWSRGIYIFCVTGKRDPLATF